jgi:hypothetical protein
MARDISEKHDRLWWVAASPGIWAVHFSFSYATAAVWCAKYAGPDASSSAARWAIGAFTLVALALVGVVAHRGLQQWRVLPSRAPSARPSDEADSPEARHHFLGFTLLALSGLSALAILYAALAAAFIGSCR